MPINLEHQCQIKVRAIRDDLEWVEPNIKTFGLFDPEDTVERED